MPQKTTKRIGFAKAVEWIIANKQLEKQNEWRLTVLTCCRFRTSEQIYLLASIAQRPVPRNTLLKTDFSPTLAAELVKQIDIKRQQRKALLQVLLILLCGVVQKPILAQDQSAGVRVHPGGVGRYTPGRWGLVAGTFTNPDPTKTQEFTTVVMPPNAGGFQYGRRLSIPPGVNFVSEWPVFVPPGVTGNANFEFLKFQAGKEDQVIQTQIGEQLIQNFGSAFGREPAAWAGGLHDPQHPYESLDNLRRLNQVIRFQERRREGQLSLQLDRLSDQPEVFDPLEHLCVSHSGMLNRPALMDALRLWVQRGGRLVVAVDLAGTDLWNGLFGGTAPLTLISEASANDIRLQLNPDYRKTRFPISVVEKSYDTPIRYLRVVAENIEPIWSIDNWPVAIRLPFGKGEVVGLLIDSKALIEAKQDTGEGIPWKAIESGGARIADLIYKLPESNLISTDALLNQANQEIGYSIPSFTLPVLIALGFPVLLMVAGIWLYRRSCPERLIWLIPGLAIAIALPAVYAGIQQRSVAPATVIEYRTIRAITGQTLLASDGTSILYSPDSAPTSISSTANSQRSPPIQKGRMESRRQMIAPSGERQWLDIAFPAGLTPIPLKAATSLSKPLTAWLSFDAKGITGAIDSGPLQNPSDVILAGMSPERMSLDILKEGTLQAGIDRILPQDTYAFGTILSSQQIQRERTYRSIFETRGRSSAFPAAPTVLYWANHAREQFGVSNEDTLFTGTTLVAQPVEWRAPEPNQPILIPAGAIEYQGVASAGGKYSSTYSNQNREWVSREMATDFLLEFRIPDVCTPFDPDVIDCSLRIRAPARKVILSAGNDPSSLTEFHTAVSPLGTMNTKIPAEIVREGLKTGRFVVKLDVGELELNNDAETEPATGEQDDTWIIEAVQMNITGQRVSNQ